MKVKKHLITLLTATLVSTNTMPVFAAKKDVWKSKSEINVISREDGSGTRGAFIELIGIEQKNAKGQKVDMTTEEASITNNTSVMITNVNTDKYAIGYISLGALNDSVKAVHIEKIPPTVQNVKNGTYKLSRPFNIAIGKNSSIVTQDFINFIMSEEGQKIIENNNYIPVTANQSFISQMPAGKIVIAGSSSVSPLMEKLKETYQQINVNVQIDIQTNDSSTGIASAAQGICDIAMASRNLKDSETAKGLSSLTIALDGITVIINNANPITNLNIEDVRKIYTGEILHWKDLENETK